MFDPWLAHYSLACVTWSVPIFLLLGSQHRWRCVVVLHSSSSSPSSSFHPPTVDPYRIFEGEKLWDNNDRRDGRRLLLSTTNVLHKYSGWLNKVWSNFEQSFDATWWNLSMKLNTYKMNCRLNIFIHAPVVVYYYSSLVWSVYKTTFIAIIEACIN